MKINNNNINIIVYLLILRLNIKNYIIKLINIKYLFIKFNINE